MDTLKFRIPLRIHMKASSGFGDGYHDVFLSDLDPSKIHESHGRLDCAEFNWITDEDISSERDKYLKYAVGFDSSEVLMTATLVNYEYIVEVVTTIPLETIVTTNAGTNWEKKMTLREAIIDDLNGQLSDGIGENELAYIRYEGEEYDVWLGDLIEL